MMSASPADPTPLRRASAVRGPSADDSLSRLSLDAPPKRIAVLRALQLGDMLCAVPALRSLRAGFPDATITLIGLPWAASFARRFGRYVDEFVEFPGHPPIPEQRYRPQRREAFVADMRSRRFDLAIQLHGSGRITNRLVDELGAMRVAGFFEPPDTAPERRSFLPWLEHEAEIGRYVRLMRHLGLPDCGLHLEWPPLESDENADRAVATFAAAGPFVCVHPGARMLTRRWPVECFAEVADRLAAMDYAVVVTGSADEAELGAALTGAMRSHALDLSGKTNLDAVASIIARASLLVCNDTGVSHIAAAVRTPSVVICCGADPMRWAPLDANRHRVLHHPIACRPCMHRVCPIGHPCATRIAPSVVLEQAAKLLGQHGLQAASARRRP